MRLKSVVSSKNFRDLLLAEYPKLNTHVGYMPLLAHILYPPSGKRCVVSRNLLASMCNAKPTHFNAEKFLKSFSADILNISYSDYSILDAMAREITYADIPPYILDAQKVDRLYGENLVDLISGCVVNNRYRKQILAQDKEHVSKAYSFPVSEPTQQLLNYLNNQRGFSLDNDAINRAKHYIIEKYGANHMLDTLRSITIQPKTYFKPTERSVRVFSDNTSVLNLPKEPRKMLTSELVWLDLQSCALSVASKTFGLTDLHTFLGSGQDIWSKMYDDFGIIDHDTRVLFKPIVKQAIYAIIYGMSLRNLMHGNDDYEGLIVLLAPFGINPNTFCQNDTIKSLLDARKIQFNRIRKDKGAVCAFGRWIALSKEVQVSSVLSQVNQSYELRLLLPVLLEAMTSSQFRIVLWLHDAICIDVKDNRRRAYYIKRMQDLVKVEADLLNIPTQLNEE